MLHLITGDKGLGKTEYGYQVLKKVVADANQGMLIVPKHFTFDSDKGILHTLGPQKASEVEVLSFSRLADTVLKTYAGIHQPILPQGAKSVYMAMAIKNVKHELKVFKKQKNEIALVDMMLEAVDEFKNDVVDLEVLIKLCSDMEDGILKDKLQGIILVSQAYDALVQNSFFDTSKLMTRIFEILSDKDFFDGKTIVIDGFYNFSKQELNLISLMMKKAKDVYITLCSEDIYEQSPLSPFHVANKTAKKLINMAKLDSISVKLKKCDKEDEKKPIELELIKKNLFNLNPEKIYDETAATSLSVAGTIGDECDFVAAKIRENILINSYRYREMMVIFKNGTTYEQALKKSFEKYEIPIFDDKRQPILNQPLVTAVRNLLAICGGGFSTDLVFRYLKTGVTNFTNEEIFDLENYVFMWDIDGRQWCEDFKENAKGFGSQLSQSSIEQLEKLNSMRAKLIDPIIELKQNLEGKTGEEMCKILFEFLRDNHFDQSLMSYAKELIELGKTQLAKEQELVWDLLMEILDELAMSLGKSAVNTKSFYELFLLVTQSKSLGNLPDGFDQVTLCDIQRAVIKKARCVFIVGFNDGVLPSVATNEGFLKDSEKLKLNMLLQSKEFELSTKLQDKTYEERFLIHTAVASASEQLFLSYTMTGAKGEKMQPSSIINSMKKSTPKLKTTIIDENVIKELIKTEHSAFETYAKLYGKNDPVFFALEKYLEEKPEYKGRLQSIQRAMDNHSSQSHNFDKAQIAKQLYGENMTMSASRVEDYNKCQFMYFCKFGIGAKPRRKAKLDPMQSGTVIHWVLEKMLKFYKGKTFVTASDEEIKAKIDLYLDEYVTLYMGGLANKDSRFNYLYSRMKKTLEDLFLRLRIEFESSDFEPWKYELEISKNAEVKPFKVQLDDGYIELGGIVDRVDKMDKDGSRYIRVVDYKTGSKEFELFEVMHGINMQMLIYLMAIWKSDEQEFKQSVPSGILYFPARSEMYNAKRNEKQENKLDARLKASCKMNGMILEDDKVINGMDNSGEFKLIPISVSGKAKKYKGKFITLKELGKLSIKMDEIIKQMGDSLHSGKIEAKAIKIGSQKSACQFCEYSSVCLQQSDSPVKAVSKIAHDSVLKQLKEEVKADE